MSPTRASAVAEPLLISADPLLVDDVRRLAAAAGARLDVTADVDAAARAWAVAPVVLVGADLLPTVADAAPARRSEVHVVDREEPPESAFRPAVRIGAESVVGLSTGGSWLVELLTDVSDGVESAGATIGVVGGSGGVGGSVLAAALAAGAASGGPSLVVDLDPLGAGIDCLLGAEAEDGIRWDALVASTGRLGARSLRDALPQRDGVSVLSFADPRPSEVPAYAVREVISAARRGFAVVVLDVPRHGGELLTEVLSRCDAVVLATTLSVPAVRAASRVREQLPSAVPAVVVTRGSPAGVSPEDAAALLELPLLHAMADQRGLDEQLSLGAGPIRRRGPLARAARMCLPVLLEQAGAA